MSTELRFLRRSKFSQIYFSLLSGESISLDKRMRLLSLAVVFLRSDQRLIQGLGYRILVLFAVRFNYLRPLYDAALLFGFAPLVKGLLRRMQSADEAAISELGAEWMISALELYERNGVTYSSNQWELRDFFGRTSKEDVALVAPTSFGKSEMIIDFCFQSKSQNIVIIVPTKALIAQTRKRLLAADMQVEVCVHPDSYRERMRGVVCVYTQERFFRHFVMYPEYIFDHVLVDEAHNIFADSDRASLLSQVLILHKNRASYRSKHITTKFFTPFLANTDSIKFKYSYDIPQGKKVSDTVKTEIIFLADLKSENKVRIYDQFVNEYVGYGETEAIGVEGYVVEKSTAKNIVYINSPSKIEDFSKSICNILTDISDPHVESVVKSIREYVHEDYSLADCIAKGVMYHHGSVPDIIKLYIESIFSSNSYMRFIVCNSTLLEGVNIPATRLFVPSYKIGNRNLSSSQFKNLIGRICRYSEIFANNDLEIDLLAPEIHIISNEEYMDKSANPENYLKKVFRADLNDKDINENYLIDLKIKDKKFDKEKLQEVETFLDVIDPTVRKVDQEEVKSAITEVGFKAFVHNIREVDILNEEIYINEDIKMENKCDNIDSFLRSVSEIFISRVGEDSDFSSLKRLQESGPRDYYAMLLRWRMEHLPFALMVKNTVDYWDSVGDPVFVGRWGDFSGETGWGDYWVNISEKTSAEKANLAIVRIKEEYDFIETFLGKYFELYYDMELLTSELYLKLKYGTEDEVRIDLIKSGVNNHLAHMLTEKYTEHFQYTEEGELYIDDYLIDEMERQGENPISIFEAKLMLGI